MESSFSNIDVYKFESSQKDELFTVTDGSTVFGKKRGSFFGCWTDCFFDALVHAMEVTSVCTALNALTKISPVPMQGCAGETLHATFCGG